MPKKLIKIISTNNKGLPVQAGFTIVETLVAIGILTVAMAGTLTAISGGLKSSNIAKDQIVAFYLVQEGMEFLKSIRDENTLSNLNGSPTNWLTGISANGGDPCYFGTVCRVDSLTKVITACGANFSNCPVLRQDKVSGSITEDVWGYDALWTPTLFKRGIRLTSISADEVLVTINVSWTNKGVAKSFEVTQLFFNR